MRDCENAVVTEEKSRRIHWLDVARVFAIISISLNHALNRSYPILHDQYDGFLNIGNAAAFFAAIIQIISRLGVPVFLMISGALLLKKDFNNTEDVKRFYKVNLLPLFITTEIWLFIMFWYLNISKVLAVSGIGDVIKLLCKMVMTMCFTNQITMGSMWYMPMILCIYLIIPIMALAVKKFSAKAFVIPCAVVCLSSFLVPNINAFLYQLGIRYQFNFVLESANIFSMYLVYVLAGYYIGKGLLRDIANGTLFGVMIFGFAGSCVFQLFSFKMPYGYVVYYDSIGILATSICLFEFFRRFCYKEFKFSKITKYISTIAFGIYFVHICIMEGLKYVIDSLQIAMPLPVRLSVLEIVSVGVSILIIAVLSKINFFKKYIFLIKS